MDPNSSVIKRLWCIWVNMVVIMVVFSIYSSSRHILITILIYGNIIYGTCPKSSYTRVSDKLAYANSADLMEQFDQGLHYTVFAIRLSISGNNCMELSV